MRAPRPAGYNVLVDRRGWYLAADSEFDPGHVRSVFVPDAGRAMRFWKGGEAQRFADKWSKVVGPLTVRRTSVPALPTEGGRG